MSILRTEIVSSQYFLADRSPEHNDWDRHRSDANTIQYIYGAAQEYERYAERIQQCSGLLKFAYGTDNQLVLKYARFCRVRYCPVCQWRRSMMWRAKFFQRVLLLQFYVYTRINPYCSRNLIFNRYVCPSRFLLPVALNHRWVFLTLTVRNPEIKDLRKTLKQMSVAWNKFIQYKALSAIDGFVRTTEVTRGQDGTAHPHYHVLFLVKPSFFGKSYVTNDRFRQLWQTALKSDYLPVTHVKAVKKGEFDKAVLEVLKYSTKPSDMYQDDKWFLELHKQTFKTRFIATGGILKHVLKEDENQISDRDYILAGQEADPDTDTRRLAFTYSKYFRKYHRNPHYDCNIDDE